MNVEKIKNILQIKIDWENGFFKLKVYILKFLEYTPKKEKNGTEIYVGDIVLWKEIDNFGNTAIRYKIASSYFEITNYIDLEVIGNIYQKTVEVIKNERKEK